MITVGRGQFSVSCYHYYAMDKYLEILPIPHAMHMAIHYSYMGPIAGIVGTRMSYSTQFA